MDLHINYTGNVCKPKSKYSRAKAPNFVQENYLNLKPVKGIIFQPAFQVTFIFFFETTKGGVIRKCFKDENAY